MLNDRLTILSISQFAEMRLFHAHVFFNVGQLLQFVETVSKDGDGSGKVLHGGDLSLSKQFKDIADGCEKIKYRLSTKTARRIAKQLSEETISWVDLGCSVRDLNSRISDEMLDGLCYVISDEEKDLLVNRFPFGGAVATRFDGAKYDIQQATKCLILLDTPNDLNAGTACVFHLMRIWEHCTKEYGRLLKLRPKHNKKRIPIDEAGWQQILDLAVNKLGAKPSRVKKSDKQKWSLPLPFLLAIKDGYRNDVMHTGSKYSASDARGLYALTKDYLASLVEIL